MSHWQLITFDTSWRTFQIFHWFVRTILFPTIPTYCTTHFGYTNSWDPVCNWIHDVESKMQAVKPHAYSVVQLLSRTDIPLSLNAPLTVPGNNPAVELLALSTPPPQRCVLRCLIYHFHCPYCLTLNFLECNFHLSLFVLGVSQSTLHPRLSSGTPLSCGTYFWCGGRVSFGIHICGLHLSLFWCVQSGASVATSGSICSHCNWLVSRGDRLVSWGERIGTRTRICF